MTEPYKVYKDEIPRVYKCERKIKLFSGESKEAVERDVNNFVNETPSKSIFDIKMDTTIHKSGMCIFTVMIEYEEYNKV